jgi:hypothetical protein
MSGVDWVRDFYSTTGRWWGAAEAVVTGDDHDRFDWATRHGRREHRDARPADGYPCELDREFTFDQHTCTAVGTWWETARPEQRISQRLRCYTPADLALLLTGTGLRLDAVHPPADPDTFNYLAVLAVLP